MTKPCKILQTTQEILPSTCCHNIFETCNIFELILAVGAAYFPQNCTIILKNIPNLQGVLGSMLLKSGNSHNVKSVAIGAFLKCIVVKRAN